MSKKNKVFSGLDRLPKGLASEHLTEGCVVLEGGAFRGLYTSGVLDALMEAGINLSCTVGVSAGALNGMNYVSGQIGRSGRLNLTYRHDSRYVGLKAIRKNRGVIGFDFILKNVNKEDPLNEERFFRPDRRFIVVATDCITGRPRYFEKSEGETIFQAVRASASMPYVSKMVMINGVPYLDGGCSDKVPFRWPLDQGYQKVIVIRTRPMDYRKKERSDHSLTDRLYHDYPQFSRVLDASNANYNRQCRALIELAAKKKIYVIAPSRPIDISRLEGDMEKLGGLYFLGYENAKKQLPAIREYLGIQ